MVNVLSAIKQYPKRAMALAVVAAAVLIPVGLNAYGPERPTYTIESPASHVTFNSITNNPNVGDERNFVGARENTGVNAGVNNVWNANEIQVQPGKSYLVRMYVHNNAGANMNKVAENVKAYFNMETSTKTTHQIQGTIASSNATPQKVYDHVDLKSDKPFNLRFEHGSLRYENNKAPAGGWKFANDNNVFSNGVTLGYDAMNGKIPGCFEYAGYLSFVVTPQFAGDFEVSKQVKIDGTDGWKKSVNAKAGDTVKYFLKYKNTGGSQQDNVTYFDKLPAGLSYIDGSAEYSFKKNGQQVVEKATQNVTTTGVNVGSYAPGAESWLTFKAKVNDNDKLPVCGVNNLRNIVSIKPETGGYQPKEDDATVVVNKDCKYIEVCDLTTGTVVKIDEKAFDAKKHSKNLADCDKVKVCDTTTNKVVTVKKSESKDSKYTTDMSKCAPAPVTPVTPATPIPAELPETGISEGLGVIGAGALVLAGTYYLSSRRMLS